ncbi:MAG: hypothetical protein IKK91_00315 [Ruminococcus sp.]|nr:hypothetical protein [Ruminococcus sp.]
MATFYNQATLSYNGNLASSNITAGEILENLFVTKTPVNSNYSADRDNSYVISIVNNSSVSYDNVTITDDLGEYVFNPPDDSVVPLTYIADTVRYFVNGIPQADPAVASENPLTITGISVPAGGNAVIVYSARANNFAPLGEEASITNTATVSGDGFTDISASSTTTPENSAFLSISKSLSPAAVEENGRVTYTFTIQNNGGIAVDASDDVIFRDDFTPPLTNITATFNGTPWIEEVNYNYSAASGVFTSLEGQITVPAATYVQDPTTGAWSVQPGISTLVISGNIT